MREDPEQEFQVEGEKGFREVGLEDEGEVVEGIPTSLHHFAVHLLTQQGTTSVSSLSPKKASDRRRVIFQQLYIIEALLSPQSGLFWRPKFKEGL